MDLNRLIFKESHGINCYNIWKISGMFWPCSGAKCLSTGTFPVQFYGPNSTWSISMMLSFVLGKILFFLFIVYLL